MGKLYNYYSNKSNTSLQPFSAPLRVCVWNFNGLKSNKVQHIKETKCEALYNILDNNDLICFSETWRNTNDTFQLDWDANFAEFHEAGGKHFRGGRPSGGMSLLIRKPLLKSCSIVSADSFHVWCKLNKQNFGWAADLYICFLYIPPSTSNWFLSGRSLTFDSLQEECATYDEKGWVLLFGDLNARTGDLNDFIENDEIDEYLPLDDNYKPDKPLRTRINNDKELVNTSGQSLIEFCKSTGYRILNGRINENATSSFTCFTSNGNSVVDYGLSKSGFFDMVEKFHIGELCEISDHCSLEMIIKSCSLSSKKDAPSKTNSKPHAPSSMDNLKNSYKNRFSLKSDSLESLKLSIESVESREFLMKIERELDDEESSVEAIVDSLRQNLIQIAEHNLHSRSIFGKQKTKSKIKCAWFDSECKNAKQLLNKARKLYQNAIKSSFNSSSSQITVLRSKYFAERRQFKKLLKKKRNAFLNVEKDKLWSLKTDSPKEFWKKLNGGRNTENPDFTNEHLFDYFKDLLNNNSAESTNNDIINSTAASLDDIASTLIDESLNCAITYTEVKQMVSNLKVGKASGLDMLNAELLKSLNDRFIHVFVKLFNKILQTGEFPEEWSIGIIVLLFKGGDQSILDNYRGITLLSIFGKLFLGILLARLNKVVEYFQILSENQIAYRKGYQTSDHIFTLRAIIENTFQRKKGALYLCFVDFRKAFDSVNHKILLNKLATYGISGNFLNIISSLYSKVKSCVRGKNGLTDLFPCSRGVRQGCVLSPILFALFLNDLSSRIAESSAGVPFGDDTIHTLLYADDLVLLATSPADLQSQLDELHSFTSSVNMEVNMDKTKIMLLRNKKRKSRAKPENKKIWTIGGKELKECETYKYLGFTIKSNGMASVHVDKVREKALKSYFSLLSKSREWGGFQPRLFLHLFDHTIMPILTYASEVWGTIQMPKIERLHLSACKYALGVKSSTNTEAVYAELGRMSVQSHIHVNILKFFARINQLDSHRYANIAFNMLLDDVNSGCANWVSVAQSLQSQYNVAVSDSNSAIKLKVQQHFQSVIMEHLRVQITEDKKLKTYALFKTTFKFETYLDVIPNFKVRSCFAKLRLSAHSLHIETGRYGGKNKIPRAERYCQFCKLLGNFELEDELHFIMVCSLFSAERKLLLDFLYNRFPSTKLLDNQSMVIWL